MGWFNKKKEASKVSTETLRLPQIPSFESFNSEFKTSIPDIPPGIKDLEIPNYPKEINALQTDELDKKNTIVSNTNLIPSRFTQNYDSRQNLEKYRSVLESPEINEKGPITSQVINQTIPEVNKQENVQSFKKFPGYYNPSAREINSDNKDEIYFKTLAKTEPKFQRVQVKKPEPIYIRIDKFETTIQAFFEIKNKITEIEELITKTKEIKNKEQKELEEWEHELQLLKTRIDYIDQNIFSKLD
jgi:hypothetical protein